ncbi:hypothetical protein E2C01_070475 [Portunus trituberculatus]|uniref:Uncharacterized protein n=1 Tax=Portunus trituberculatus TaxID=210409 RepID=A0A5B7I5J0_PORTR|nr:hypothetical protein [Portunus trituberculatus]
MYPISRLLQDPEGCCRCWGEVRDVPSPRRGHGAPEGGEGGQKRGGTHGVPSHLYESLDGALRYVQHGGSRPYEGPLVHGRRGVEEEHYDGHGEAGHSSCHGYGGGEIHGFMTTRRVYPLPPTAGAPLRTSLFPHLKQALTNANPTRPYTTHSQLPNTAPRTPFRLLVTHQR